MFRRILLLFLLLLEFRVGIDTLRVHVDGVQGLALLPEGRTPQFQIRFRLGQQLQRCGCGGSIIIIDGASIRITIP